MDEQDVCPGQEARFHQGLEHEQAVQAEFFQNARVHHRHRGGGGGIGGGRPRMEREQGDQGAESGDQQGADQFRIFQGLSALDEVLEAGEGEPGLRSDHQ